MSENEAPWLIQVSLKTSAQSLINVRGMTVGEVESGLDGIIEIAGKIAEAETAVGVVQMVRSAMGTGTAVVPPQAPPATAPPASPSAPAPVCNHGLPAKFVAGGVSKKTNRPYSAFWACSQDQAYQCDFKQSA